jgi:hypothetical protein
MINLDKSLQKNILQKIINGMNGLKKTLPARGSVETPEADCWKECLAGDASILTELPPVVAAVEAV